MIDIKKRFLRAQNPTEKQNVTFDANMRKKDIDAWRFFQLIECCKHFQQESSRAASRATNTKLSMVTLLQDTQSALSIAEIALTNGINVLVY